MRLDVYLFYPFYILFLFVDLLPAQSPQPLQTLRQSVSIVIPPSGSGIQGQPPLTETDLRITGLRLEKGELALDFELPNARKRFVPDADYRLAPGLRLPDGRELRAQPGNLVLEMDKSSNSKILKGSVLWMGFMEQAQMTGPAELILSARLYGTFDCTRPPEFGLSQKLPYYLVGGVGIASIALSFPVENDADKTYENYLEQETQAEAEPLYNDANNKRHTYLIMRYGGVALVLADAALFYLRSRKYRREKEMFDRFCQQQNQPLTFAPVIDPVGPNGIGSVGMALHWRFGK